MKKALITALALSAITTTAFSKATVQTTQSKCVSKRAYLDKETNTPTTSILSYTIEYKTYSSKDKQEETEIYKYLENSFNGEPNEDLSDQNGVAKNSYQKLSENETKVTTVDSFEYDTYEDDGKPKTVKESYKYESVWKTLEKTDKKEVSLRVSYAIDGKESKEQVLKTKLIISDKENIVEQMTLNPQEVNVGEADQLLFSSKSCHNKTL